MRRHARHALLAAILCLVACSTPARKEAPSLTPAPPPLDASYDWHVLLLAPFGTLLKDMPLSLHEVLLFNDTARSAAEDPECYAPDSSATRFISRAPEEYLLCFRHDRLTRLEATLRLPGGEAAQIFKDACGLWTGNPHADRRTCEGADGAIRFAARLESDADETESQLIIQLEATESAQDRPAER